MGTALTRVTVLVVDDDPTVLRVVVRTLTRHADVVSAVDAAEARKALGERSFDIVITDFGMPGEDGLSLLAYVAEVQPSATRILFSGAPPDHAGTTAFVHHVVEKTGGAPALVPFVRK